MIGGHTDPRGEQIGLWAVLVGYYRGDELVYAGQVERTEEDKPHHPRFVGLRRDKRPREVVRERSAD